MKKILISIVSLFFIFCLSLSNISAKGISELLVNYYESDSFDKYMEQSSQFIFSEDMLNSCGISECFTQINATTNCELELVYNIFGESQYLLIEENSDFKKAYIIYDFMLEEAIEYNDKCLSIWSLNQNAIGSVKLYLNFNLKYYINDNVLYDVFGDSLIAEINDLSSIINFQEFKLTDEVYLNSIQIEEYESKIIREEYDITNSFFFENFYIDDDHEFNYTESCAIVATSLLLSYYDVFFNDNIVPDIIEYEGCEYLTRNYIAQDVVHNSIDSSLSKDTDGFYIDTWNQRNFHKTGEWEFTGNMSNIEFISPAGPTRRFHNYLVEMAKDNDYFVPYEGMTILNVYNLINKHLDYVNFTSIDAVTNFNDLHIIDCLNNDIPVILGMCGYEYFYEFGSMNSLPRTIGIASGAMACHSVVAYGYQNTSIGTFYHVNMGWGIDYTDIDDVYGYKYYNDTYLNANLMGLHAYIDASNVVHVCSNQYQLYDANSGIVKEICPCESFEENFDFITYDNEYDFVDINNDNIFDIQFLHKCDDIEQYNELYHIGKCRLYDYCGQVMYLQHDFSIIGSANDSSHYIKCRDCGYTKYGSHLSSDIETYNSDFHTRYCSYCLEYYDINEHIFLYSGNDESHEGVCRDCDYIQEYDTHNVSISYYYEQKHLYLCECGYERSEIHTFDEDLICTLCGYEHLNHTYSYSKYSGSQHIKYCLCGEEIYESHSFNIGLLGNTCKHCGYFTTGFVTIDSTIGDVEYDSNSVLYCESINQKEEENNEK